MTIGEVKIPKDNEIICNGQYSLKILSFVYNTAYSEGRKQDCADLYELLKVLNNNITLPYLTIEERAFVKASKKKENNKAIEQIEIR
jgi:hypothetical protein